MSGVSSPMRTAVLALGAALAVSPAFAKGPLWTRTRLEQQTAFGEVVFARGDAGVYRSGAPGYGTLAEPLEVFPGVRLPERTLVTFADAGLPHRANTAAVPRAFAACGVEFGPASPLDPPYLGGVAVPAGSVPVRFFVLSPDRSDHANSPAVAGRLLRALTVRGLELPALTQLTMSCKSETIDPIEWSGWFERDTEVGGLLLRGRAPAGVAFSESAPRATSGVLARPAVFYGRTLPVETRILVFEGGIVAECPGPGTRVSMFSSGMWHSIDCGLPVPAVRTAVEPRRVVSRFQASHRLGVVALLASGALFAAALAMRRGFRRASA